MSLDRPADAAREALGYLGRRYSFGPKYLGLPAPGRQELQAAAELALRAPDHQQLRPFRFVRVADEHRDRLATLFAADARRRGHAEAEVERARERAHNGPALVALLVRVQPQVDDVPGHEQWMCAGAGLMNFLNALHLMGYGAKVLSGASVRDDDIQAAFCRPGETLAAWIVAGTPSRRAQPKAGAAAEPVLGEWDGQEPALAGR
jgi:nitroreductase